MNKVQRTGFSLVELMVAIAILSVVAAGATVAFQTLNQGINTEIVRTSQTDKALLLEKLLRIDLERHGQGIVDSADPCLLNFASSRTPQWHSSCADQSIEITHGIMLCFYDTSDDEFQHVSYHVEGSDMCRNTWIGSSCDTDPYNGTDALGDLSNACASPLGDPIDSVDIRIEPNGGVLFEMQFAAEAGISGNNTANSQLARLVVNPKHLDRRPVLEVLDTALTVSSGADFSWILLLDQPATSDFNISVDPGTANCASPCEAEFDAGDTSAVVAVSASQATTLSLLADNSAVRLGRNQSTAISIGASASEAVSLQLSSDTLTAKGEDLLLTLRVTEPRVANTNFIVTVSGLTCITDYVHEDGDGMNQSCAATDPTDITLPLAAGETEVTHRLDPRAFSESGELSITLASAATQTVQLIPDAELPDVTFDSSSSRVWEPIASGSRASVPIVLSSDPAPEQALSVIVQASGSGLGGCGTGWQWGNKSSCSDNSFSWPKDRKRITLPLEILHRVGNQQDETLELIFATSQVGLSATGSHTVTLDEYARINFASSAITIAEASGASTIQTINLTATPAPTEDLTVTFSSGPGSATAGIDFASGAVPITWTSGSSSASFDFTVSPDSDTEGTETTTLNIQRVQGLGLVGTSSSLSISITDP